MIDETPNAAVQRWEMKQMAIRQENAVRWVSVAEAKLVHNGTQQNISVMIGHTVIGIEIK